MLRCALNLQTWKIFTVGSDFKLFGGERTHQNKQMYQQIPQNTETQNQPNTKSYVKSASLDSTATDLLQFERSGSALVFGASPLFTPGRNSI